MDNTNEILSIEKEQKLMSLDINLSEEDYIKFSQFHSLNNKQSKKSGRKLKIYFSVVILLCFLVMYMQNGTTNLGAYVNLLIFAAVVVIIMLSIPAINKLIVKKVISNQKKQGKLPYKESFELTFFETGIVEKTDTSVASIKYEEIEKINETDDAIYVYLGAVQAIVIPKRCLNGKRDEMMDILNSKTPLSIVV